MTDSSTPGGAVEGLRECPFCSRAAKSIPDEIGSGGQHVSPYHVGCSWCRVYFSEENEADAIAAWNRRALSSPPALDEMNRASPVPSEDGMERINELLSQAAQEFEEAAGADCSCLADEYACPKHVGLSAAHNALNAAQAEIRAALKRCAATAKIEAVANQDGNGRGDSYTEFVRRLPPVIDVEDTPC